MNKFDGGFDKKPKENLGEGEKKIDIEESAACAFNEGFFSMERGDIGNAIRVYDKTIEIDPKNPVAWVYKGIAFDKLGKYNDALKYYNRAVEIEPEYTFAWLNMGHTFRKLEMDKEANECYKKVEDIRSQRKDDENKKVKEKK